MGWTSFASYGRDTVEILRQEMTCDNAHGKWEWIAHSKRGSVVYSVIQFTPKGEWEPDRTYINNENGAYRFITVHLTSRRRASDGYDFSHKEVTECMGPCERHCPVKLIRLASPLRTQSGGAHDWREACLNNSKAARIAKAAAPKPGQKFKTLRPVKFKGGWETNTFECVRLQHRGKMRTFYTASNCSWAYLRFKPADYGFEILEG